MFDGEEAVPEFAGRRLQYAMLFLDLEERKPVSVKYAEWHVLLSLIRFAQKNHDQSGSVPVNVLQQKIEIRLRHCAL